MTTLGPTLTFDDYLRHLRTESASFREAITACDSDARVPSCPDWDADDLLWHLGEVQHFWAGVITNRPAAPEDVEPTRPHGREALLGFFDASSQALVDALTAADPAEVAWTWSTEQSVGFTYRRQALEALVHRLDAEQAAGEITTFDPALCLDGVFEVIGVMFGGHPDWGHFEPSPQHVRLHLTDVDSSVWAQLGVFSGTDPGSGTSFADEPDIGLAEDPGTEADVVVSGTSPHMLAWLWRRTDAAAVTMTGDLNVYDRFRTIVSHPIN